MNRSDILKEAKRIVTKDRAATHGNAEDNFTAIADGWEWWMNLRKGGHLTSYDVAMMMVIFKIARAASNNGHTDNFIDGAGYFALAGEISTETPLYETPLPDHDDM